MIIKLLFGLLIVLIVAYLIVWAYFAFRTHTNEQGAHQKHFAAGHLPDPLPNGPYKGTVDGYSGDWKGKEFDAETKSGANNFNGTKRDPFKTYTAEGLRDKSLKVFRIDYDVSPNPWWLRHLVDEVTEVTPGKYQGKIMVRWLGSTFTVGYFQLEK